MLCDSTAFRLHKGKGLWGLARLFGGGEDKNTCRHAYVMQAIACASMHECICVCVYVCKHGRIDVRTSPCLIVCLSVCLHLSAEIGLVPDARVSNSDPNRLIGPKPNFSTFGLL